MESEVTNNDNTMSNQEVITSTSDSIVDETINTVKQSTPPPQEEGAETNNMSIDENSSLVDQSMESQEGIGR